MAKGGGTPKRARRRARRGGFLSRTYRRLTGRANGGPVRANVPYVVGERGPELLYTSTPGRISTIPGGTGRAARMSRAPGRGFAALGKEKKGLTKRTKDLILGAVAGGGAFAIGEVFDRVGLAPLVQGGIFFGVALGLAMFGQVPAAVGVLSIGIYELGAATWKWFKGRYPGVLAGGNTPAPNAG